MKDEKLYSMLNHENSHANKAEYLGQEHIGYNITVTKDDDKIYKFFPYVISSISGYFKESANVVKKIAQAPEDSGDTLSSYDKNIISTKK